MGRPKIAFGHQQAEEGLLEGILRERAESLAAEQQEQAVEDMLSLLLFSLGDEWYAVPIRSVREIYNEYIVTPVPCTPPFVLGVINIRGEIVSVTDVKQLLRLPASTPGAAAPVIVVENDLVSTALLVEEIGDIVDVPHSGLEAPIATLDKSQAAFVSGSAYIEGRLIGLLDLEAVLTPMGVEV
jgi:purine-binding chemotaxis protein CheW